ncbi:MAG: hypothetical protein RLZZ165_2481 [Bacteroidota bacterium]
MGKPKSMPRLHPYCLAILLAACLMQGSLPAQGPSAPGGNEYAWRIIPVIGGASSLRIEAYNDTPLGLSPEGGSSSGPEIDILGKNVSIPDGSPSISPGNNTDFGAQTVCRGSVTHTFVIANTDNFLSLIVDSITLSGANSEDFTLTLSDTFPQTIRPRTGQFLFDVTFDPNATGSRSATVTVFNDDADEGTYTFTIGGKGLRDSLPPTARCKQSLTLPLDSTGQASITAADVDDGSSDSCRIHQVLSDSTFTCTNIGTSPVILTVTDDSGNSATCTANVTVSDAMPPKAICRTSLVVYLDGTGNATLTEAEVDSGSSDNCAVAQLALNRNTFTCMDIGTSTVALTVTDSGGNSATCTLPVTVRDTIRPTAVCKDLTLTLDSAGQAATTASAVNGTSSDNCGIESIALSKTSFSCANVGPNWVVLTVVDSSGNSDLCEAVVRIIHRILPPTFYVSSYPCGYGVSCHGASDGIIHASAGERCPWFVGYQWSNGEMSRSLYDVRAGSYTLTVTNFNGIARGEYRNS